MALSRDEILNAIMEKLVFEDVLEDIMETLNRDLTDEEADQVDEALTRTEKIFEKYL